MNIYKLEFKMIYRSVIVWSVAIFVLMFVMMSVFSSIAADAELLNSMMSQFPDELMIAFGMDNLDLSTVLGFYSFGFIFAQICLAIQAANYGFSLVSVEERDLTADFLLAKPVSRPRIMTSKLLAALTGLTITNIAVWIGSFVLIYAYKGGRAFEMEPLLLLLLSIALFQLFFLGVGLFISLLVKKVRAVAPFSMALAFGMYVLTAFGGMLGQDKLEIISPFRHFDPSYIVSNSAYEVPLVLLTVAVIILSIVGSYLLYMRRDMASAV